MCENWGLTYMKLFYMLLITLVLFATASAQLKPPTETAMSRFLRYVKIDTQSAEDQPSPPSTKKQLDLARLLKHELDDFPLLEKFGRSFAYVHFTRMFQQD